MKTLLWLTPLYGYLAFFAWQYLLAHKHRGHKCRCQLCQGKAYVSDLG